MTLRSPYEMTEEQLSIALKNTYTLEVWIKAVRAHAYTVLKNGGKIQGFKLGYGVRRRIWREEVEKEVVKALTELGLGKEELYTEPALKTPAQVEKVMKEHGLWPKKPKNGERPPSKIDKFITMSTPDLSVQPADGKYSVSIDERNREATEDFK